MRTSREARLGRCELSKYGIRGKVIIISGIRSLTTDHPSQLLPMGVPKLVNRLRRKEGVTALPQIALLRETGPSRLYVLFPIALIRLYNSATT